MKTMILASSPPEQPWTIGDSTVIDLLQNILNIASLLAFTVAILATIAFGAMMALDRDRGEPISSTAPQIMAVRIILGAIIIGSASAIANFLMG